MALFLLVDYWLTLSRCLPHLVIEWEFDKVSKAHPQLR